MFCISSCLTAPHTLQIMHMDMLAGLNVCGKPMDSPYLMTVAPLAMGANHLMSGDGLLDDDGAVGCPRPFQGIAWSQVAQGNRYIILRMD